jgi:uncharacterized protein YcfJ
VSRCEARKHNDRVAGTVLGGVVGALAGSAIAGHGSRAGGALIGGAVGAVAGNQIARSGDHPCPPGYVYRTYDDRYYNSYYNRGYDQGRYSRSANCSWEDRSYRDASGRVIPQEVQVCR